MDKVRIFALGGLDENGKNLYVIEINQDIFLIEAGSKYPETDQLGVLEIINDYSYLTENSERIVGIFITHAHDDVMGGLSFLIKQINIPIYTTPFTSMMIKSAFEKNHLTDYKINTIERSGTLTLNGRKIRTFALTNSIVDNFGVAISTDLGLIVYCGEFIIDLDIRNQFFASDIAQLAEIGKEKVFALLCESSQADKDGYTSPKHQITHLIENAIETAPSRIIISCYQQNLYRVMEILNLANKYNKRVFFYSRTLNTTISVVEALGYYHFPKKLIISKQDFNNDDDDVIVLVSGIGPHVFNRMMRIATKEEEQIRLRENDTVIIASPAIGETEVNGSNMKNELYRENVTILSLDGRQVSTVHASQEDIKMMIYLLKPEYYFPIKGEYRQMVNNANIALDMGYRADHIVVLDNGQIATFDGHTLVSTSDLIDTAEVMIGSDSNMDISSFVLKDREVLSQDGVIIVGVALNYNTKDVIAGPDIQSRGLIYLKDADYIIKEVGNILLSTIQEAKEENRFENMQVRMEAREKISRYLLRETGKRPMILPAIVEINISE